MRYWTEEQRRQSAEAFLASVHAVKRQAESVPSTSDLTGASSSLLIKAALEPGKNLLDMYRDLGLHPAEGKAAQEDLVARGFVRVHRLVRKGRGGQPQVLEVTHEGVQALLKRGITPAPRLLKGGFCHDCYARLLARWAAERKFRISFERTLGAKSFDAVYEDEHGSLHGLEICLTGSAAWTAQQLLKAAGVEGVAQVVGLCETQSFAKGVKQEFERIDQLGLYRNKVQVCLLADFLE